MTKFAGADWVKSALKVDELSPLGVAVANLLGDLFGGIYHLEDRDLKKVEWDNDHHIIFVLNWKDLSTFDSSLLTSLVILCHDRAIRCQISARSSKGIELMFHQRTRSGGISERHPTIEEAINRVRAAHPLPEIQAQ